MQAHEGNKEMPVRSADPRSPPMIITLTKKSVAHSQLEAAITLWFQYGDPVSIFMLASAANDCYHYLGRHIGFQSIFQIWLRKQPRGFQRIVDDARNFAKHGHIALKGKKPFAPVVTDQLIMDSIICHGVISAPNYYTAIMRLFITRFAVEYPTYEIPPVLEGILDREQLKQLLRLNRLEFFQEFSGAPDN